MFYKIYEGSSATAIAVANRVTNLRFSHLLISGTFASTVTLNTELAKLSLSLALSGKGVERNLANGIPLSYFAAYCDLMQGNPSDVDLYTAGGAVWRILIPIGDIALDKIDLVYSLSGTLATASTIKIYGVRQADGEPIIEYQKRAISTDGINVDNCLLAYDVAGASNDSVITTLTFDNKSQVTIPHDQAFHLMNVCSKVESDVPFAVIFADKDMIGGSNLNIQPSSAFDAFLVILSPVKLS